MRRRSERGEGGGGENDVYVCMRLLILYEIYFGL